MPHTPLICAPLSPNALNAVFDSLHPQGFKKDSMIEENYSFSEQEGRLVKTNALVFAHEFYRTPDYTGVTVFNFSPNGLSEENLVKTLAQTAAPFHLIHNVHSQTYNFWFTSFEGSNVQATSFASGINYSYLAQVVEKYTADISPSRIINVKQGRDIFKNFEQANGYQLSLWAIEVTSKQLVEKFGRAVADLRNQGLDNQLVTYISIQTLAAVILAHTGALGSQIRQDESPLNDILIAAHKYFPNYFDISRLQNLDAELRQTYQILSELRYSGFAPEMLTALYREAFPDTQDKRELGRYDTPLYLTRRIWETIPVEYLRPDQRLSVDMTCGWGSFLLAAHERLSRMSDMKGVALRNHIFGNDKDSFTSRLAGLSLLTATRQDSWKIDHADALQWNFGDRKPNIIVGNPPFGGNRKTINEGDYTSRIEKANDFLKHAIDILADGGYLAMLMPQSFVAAEASPAVRKHLLTNCDVFELWELPIGIFEAQANSIVIFAQKRGKGSSYPTRIRSIQSKHINSFREHGVFSSSSMVSDQSLWDESSKRTANNNYIIEYKLLLPEHSWNKIVADSLRLDDVAVVFQGMIEGQKPEKKRLRNHVDGVEIEWYKGVRNVIKASFYTAYENPLNATYPNDFEEPRYLNRKYLTQEKVLINALANNSQWGKKVKVTIDRRGVYVSHNFVVIALHDQPALPYLSHEIIAAVLDWKVCNAWLLEYLKQTQFPISAIRALPFPKLTLEECIVIKNAVLEIETAKQGGKASSNYAQSIIDATLHSAYKLDDATYRTLTTIVESDENNTGLPCSHEDIGEWWNVCGVVDKVGAATGYVTLWMRGFDTLQTVPISPQMPGWMFREGATFCTKIPRKLLKAGHLENNQAWGRFYPQEYSYMDEMELINSLNELIH